MCPSCSSPTPSGTRFCGQCGASLPARCPGCDEAVDPTAAFCSACGEGLRPPATGDQGPGPFGEERRTVTVLVADLVGFTAAAHALDPEDLQRTQRAFFETVRDTVVAFGGTVEKYVGDAVVSVFGAPVAHENDPYRAVRAGLEVQRSLTGLSLSDGRAVTARVGVATGEALVRLDDTHGEALVTGEVAGLADALQSASPEGGVLVGPLAHRATASSVDYGEQRAVAVPGRSAPLEAWVATRIRARTDDVVDTLPLVGREPEVALLTGALQRAVQENRCQLVTLVADPGIGKSRLVRALKEFLDSPALPALVRWRSGHCLPYGEGVAFWALGQVVKAQAGILETDSATVAGLRLETSVHSLLGRSLDPVGVAGVTASLATLLGLPTGSPDSAEAHSAWRRYLVALAEDAPTVLVLEDLHWADEALLDFVQQLAEAASSVPLLIVTTARPELLRRRADWSGGLRDALTLTLAPLNERDTALVLTRLLGQTVLPAALQERLIDLSGGNPLYAEEYVRMLVDSGVVVRDQLQPAAATGMDASALDALPLPDSVQGVVDSRLDLLTPAERLVVSAAAVVGEVFWEGAVAAVADTDRDLVRTCLHSLEQREVVRRAPTTAVEGEEEYAFRHVLVRDAAYHRISRVVRLSHHERCAGWLDRLAAHRGDDVAELQAHHRTSVFELAATLGLDTEPHAQQARSALTAAAERALRLQSIGTAHALAQRAVMLWHGGRESLGHWQAVLFAEEVFFLHAQHEFHDSGGPARIAAAGEALLELGHLPEAARAETLLGRIEWFRAEEAQARLHVSRALDLLTDQPDSEQKASALVELARIDMLAHRLDSAAELAERARTMGRELGLQEIEANALITLGCARYLTGDEQGMTDQAEALQFCRDHRLRATARAMNNLAATLQEEGQLRRSYGLLAELRTHGKGFGLSLTSTTSLADQALQAYYDGDWDAALDLAHELLDDSGDAAHWEVHLVVLRAWLLMLRGDDAPDDLDRALRAVRHGGFPQLVRPVLALVAACRLLDHRHEEAVELLDELVDDWDRHGIGGGAREWLPATTFSVIALAREDGGRRLQQVAERLEAVRRPTLWVKASLASCRSAWLALEGQPAEALEQALLTVALHERIADASGRALAAAATVKTAWAAGDEPAARRLEQETLAFVSRSGAKRLLHWIERPLPV